MPLFNLYFNLEDSSMTPAVGLPDGWLRKKHETKKSSWYTFVSPAGKSFKNIKSAKAFIEETANSNFSAILLKQGKIIEEEGSKGRGIYYSFRSFPPSPTFIHIFELLTIRDAFLSCFPFPLFPSY